MKFAATALFLLVLGMGLDAHEVTVTGMFVANGQQKHSGIEITIEADTLWGHQDAESLAETEKVKGKFPKPVVEGSTLTTPDGSFTLKANFRFEGEGTPPTRTVNRRDGTQVEVESCLAWLVARMEGYRESRRQVQLLAGEQVHTGSGSLDQLVTVKGVVLRLSDRTPVSDLELELSMTVAQPRPGPGPRRRSQDHTDDILKAANQRLSWKFKTDKDGRFEFRDAAVYPAQGALEPLGDEYSFAPGTQIVRGVWLREGINDLGNLFVVPGGSLELKVADAVSGEALDLRVSIRGNQYARDITTVGGAVIINGLPEGDYTLTARSESHWEGSMNAHVTGGKRSDAGTLSLEPYQQLEVHALSDGPTGIQAYMVEMQLLEGERPAAFARDRAVIVRQQLTAERPVMQRLFRGRWKVVVTAGGHASADTVVDLPAEKPLTVTLEQGAAIEVQVIDHKGRRINEGFVIALRHGSQAHKDLSRLTDEELSRTDLGPARSGLYRAHNRWGQDHILTPVPAGTYLVIGMIGNYGWLRVDNVKAGKGETAKCELKVQPPSIDLKVTENGKPAAGAIVHICVSSNQGYGWNITDHVTDKHGAVKLELGYAGMAYALTPMEVRWLGGNTQDWQFGQSLEALKGSGTLLSWGRATALTLELVDPSGAWLTIKPKLPEGTPVQHLHLAPIKPVPGLRLMGKQVEGDWLYPRVPLGDYRVSMEVLDASGKRVSISREIKVDQLPEQAIEVEFKLDAFTVSLSFDENLVPVQTHVRVVPVGELSDFGFAQAGRFAVSRSGAAVSFIGLEDGEYLVSALGVLDDHSFVAATRFVNTAEDSEVKLQVSPNVGSLLLDVVGNPALDEQQLRLFRVQFFDENDSEVFPGQIQSCIGSIGHTHIVQALPTGMYRVLVTGYGLQPCEAKSVLIERGKRASLELAPSAAAAIKATLLGITYDQLVNLKAQADFLDANGNPVNTFAPGKLVFRADPKGDADCICWLLNVQPTVAKVVIRIKGYENVEIAVQFEPGKTILQTSAVKPKAD